LFLHLPYLNAGAVLKACKEFKGYFIKRSGTDLYYFKFEENTLIPSREIKIRKWSV
jgi:hypothetical protein